MDCSPGTARAADWRPSSAAVSGPSTTGTPTCRRATSSRRGTRHPILTPSPGARPTTPSFRGRTSSTTNSRTTTSCRRPASAAARWSASTRTTRRRSRSVTGGCRSAPGATRRSPSAWPTSSWPRNCTTPSSCGSSRVFPYSSGRTRANTFAHTRCSRTSNRPRRTSTSSTSTTTGATSWCWVRTASP